MSQSSLSALEVLGESADIVDDYDDVDCSKSLLSLSAEGVFGSKVPSSIKSESIPQITDIPTKLPQIESMIPTKLPQITEPSSYNTISTPQNENPHSPINKPNSTNSTNNNNNNNNNNIMEDLHLPANLNIKTGLEREAPCRRCSNIVSYDALAEAYDPPIPVPLPNDSLFCINWCPNCKPDTEDELISIEIFSRQWNDIAEIALINLHSNSSKKKKSFIFREEICKFVSKYWDRLCIGKVCIFITRYILCSDFFFFLIFTNLHLTINLMLNFILILIEQKYKLGNYFR